MSTSTQGGAGAALRSAGRLLAVPARALAHVAALPVRAAARERSPAVLQPWTLHPGDAPPTDGRLLLLFDGGCGICLHARDVFVLLDRHHRLATDRIARHDRGLLADMDPEDRYGTWHVIRADGKRLDGADGLVAVFGALPFGAPLAWATDKARGLADRGYTWFADNRSWISQGTGLINHPQRDPREQPGHDDHEATIARLTAPGGQSERPGPGPV